MKSKSREFKISFIDEGYRGYSVVSGAHQEQVLPYIRNQTVSLHVREVSPALDAAYAECEDILKSVAAAQGFSIPYRARSVLTALRKARGE